MLLAGLDFQMGFLFFWIWLVFILRQVNSLPKKVDQVLENQIGGVHTEASGSE